MAGRSIVRIEHSDSDMRFRDKVNSNFAAVASTQGLATTVFQLIADSSVVADILIALNEKLSPDDVHAGEGIIVEAEDSFVTISLDTTGRIVFTPEGGLAVRMYNRTGSSSVKGSVVTPAASHNEAFVLQSNEFDSIGVVYEDDVPNGDLCLVVISGIADVLLKNNTAAARAQLAIAADTDGRALAIDVPSSNPVQAEHFKEIGHFTQSQSAGTDVLCRLLLHFN